MEYFGRTIGAELLFQLTQAAEQLFGTATSGHQLLDGTLPSLDFDFLVNGIRNNNLNTSQTRPALFVPTLKHTQQHTPGPRNERIREKGGGGGGGNTGGGTPSPQKRPISPLYENYRKVCTNYYPSGNGRITKVDSQVYMTSGQQAISPTTKRYNRS
jgi:hypothetical protein